jgi:hypothetical protein
MSWHDLTNTEEPEEDRALRAEVREMMGVGAATPTPQAADAAAMAALAQSLHREAVRRRRISGAPGRRLGRRAAFVALAAAVPMAVTLTALGTWGAGQKRRADALAAKTMELESRQGRMEAALEAARGAGGPAARPQEGQPALQASGQAPAQPKEKGDPAEGRRGELVKPEERPARLDNANEQYRVKDSR